MVQMEVVATRFSRIKPNRFADDEGDGFRFEFARVTRSRPVVGTVKQLVGIFVDEDDELLRR
jgi:hypothetical protein